MKKAKAQVKNWKICTLKLEQGLESLPQMCVKLTGQPLARIRARLSAFSHELVETSRAAGAAVPADSTAKETGKRSKVVGAHVTA